MPKGEEPEEAQAELEPDGEEEEEKGEPKKKPFGKEKVTEDEAVEMDKK